MGSYGGGDFSVGEAVSYGWHATLKNFGPLLTITVVIWIVQAVLQFARPGPQNDLLQTVWVVLLFAVGLILAMGLVRAALRVTDGGRPDVNQLTQTEDFLPYLVVQIIAGVVIVVGLYLCILPGIIAAVFLGFAGYVVIDSHERDPIAAVRRSIEIVKPKFGPLLGLAFLMMLINIVGLLLCFVGLLFTYPMTAVVFAYAYRSLSGQPIAPAR
ncbi:MAG: hypothetical protein ACKO72_06090 [Actinomycetes bacterium]